MSNTVSPGYARESLTPELGFGLHGALRAKGDRYVGILNGLDTTVWDPANDADLAAPLLRGATWQGRPPVARTSSRRLGFDPTDDSPVLGMIGRLDPQKGFDLLADAAPRLLRCGARLAVQGSGDPKIAAALRTLARAPPGSGRARRAVRSGDGAADLRRASDFFLMPSRFEPCGQGQMISLRYGTPPIVRRTGGLADSVIDELRPPGEGNGVRVRRRDTGRPRGRPARRRSRCARPAARAWDALVARGMAVDFDWTTGSAPRYVELYQRAVAIRRG